MDNEPIKRGDVVMFRNDYWLKIAGEEITCPYCLVLDIEQHEDFNIALLLDEEGTAVESCEDYFEKVC